MVTQAQLNQFIDNPVNFMKKNMIIYRGPGPADAQVIPAAMLFQDAGARRSGTFGKTGANRYLIRHAFPGNGNVPAGTPTFQAQWSGYAANTSKDIALPAAGGPDIMLTPELTGCTVVCRPNGDGSADFSHYNLTIGAQTLDQASMEAVAQAQYGGGQTTLTKEEYRAEAKHAGAGVRVTIIGFRRNGAWEFWAQIREDKASGEQLRSMRQLA